MTSVNNSSIHRINSTADVARNAAILVATSVGVYMIGAVALMPAAVYCLKNYLDRVAEESQGPKSQPLAQISVSQIVGEEPASQDQVADPFIPKADSQAAEYRPASPVANPVVAEPAPIIAKPVPLKKLSLLERIKAVFYRIFSFFALISPVKTRMENAVMKNLAKSIEGINSGPLSINDDWDRKVLRLKEWIQTGQKTVDEIRSLLSDCLKDQLGKNALVITFLQTVALNLRTADGLPILKNHVMKEIDAIQNKDLGALLEDYSRATQSYNRDSNWNALKWGVRHLPALFQSSKSHTSSGYNPNIYNPTHLGCTFQQGEKTAQMVYGPSPTGDRVYEDGVLPAYRAKGLKELRFTFQDMITESEAKRIHEIQTVANKNHDVLTHVVLGFETKFKHPHMKEVFKTFKSVDEFIKGYRNFVLNVGGGIRTLCDANGDSNGILIPESLLSNEQIDAIFKAAQTFFEEMPRNRPLTGKMMILTIDAMITSTILRKTFGSFNYITSSCKQHIDRGAVETALLSIFHRIYENDAPFTKDEIEDLLAGLIGRANLVEDRKIMDSKLRPMIDLLQFIGDHHTKLQKALKSIPNSKPAE